MKWDNKGHEFDNFASEIVDKDFYIYGCGEIGQALYKDIKNANCLKGFIDNSIDKVGTKYKDIPIYSHTELLKNEKKENICVIVAVGKAYETEIIKSCLEAGFEENKNLFIYWNFKKTILPILYAYICNKVYLNVFSLSVTDKCSLRCKDCALLFPYLKEKRDRELQEIKKDLDILFRNVDYISFFEIIGGEPFLYPELDEVIRYIGEYYGEKVGKLVVTTNATIIPKENILDVLKEYNVEVGISDYKKIESLHKNTYRLKSILEKKAVQYLVNSELVWVDFGLKDRSINKSAVDAEETMHTCGIECITLRDGKLYYCFAAYMAEKIFYCDKEGVNSGVIDLLRENVSSKVIMEWSLGYTDLGYLEMCKHCNGQYNNKNVVTPGIQIKSK